jgi:hypothetical protein
MHSTNTFVGGNRYTHWRSSSSKSEVLPLSMETQKPNTQDYRKNNNKYAECAWCGNIKSDGNFTFVMSRLRIIRDEEYCCTNYFPPLLECVVCSKCMKWYIPVNLVKRFPTRIEPLVIPSYRFQVSHTNMLGLFAVLASQRIGCKIQCYLNFVDSAGYRYFAILFSVMLSESEFNTGHTMKIKSNSSILPACEFEFEI